MLEVVVLLSILLASIYCIYNKKLHPTKIFNIYTQSSKWYHLKFATFFLFLWVQRLKSKLKFAPSDAQLEKLQQLSEHEEAFDSTFFQAASKNGFYFCGGIERRHRAKANGLFYIALPELGLLESSKLPNTLLDTDPSSILLMKAYVAEGISLTPIYAMKKWRVSFIGNMRVQKNPTENVKVKLEGSWTSDLPYFLFHKDTSLGAVARAVALETWNKSFFNVLKQTHQTHYEQMGYFTGTLTVDDKIYKLEMDAFKKHSFGCNRDLPLMHRSVFHMLFLENGTRISFGVLSQHCSVSALETGYIVLPNKTISCIQHSNFRLYQHGENGRPGRNYGFSIYSNGETYDVSVNVIHESTYFKGDKVEARLLERFIECEVNGTKGKGMSEWQYNNVNSSKK